ncbi:hypothetical protein EDF80_108104 [Pseudomonas brenneri]|nr:hypothetical protein EDF80_108104 [Pseudomonas brenneri]
MALQPWGGKHANLLYCLRSQGAYQLTGGNYSGLRETVLPMLGRQMRAYMGVRTDVQALLASTDTTPGNAPGRANQEFASGTTARAVPAIWRRTTWLTLGPESPTPTLPHTPLRQCHQGALPSIRGLPIRMPATQAYKPPTQSPLTPSIVVRRYPRSGRLRGKATPQNLRSTARTRPRSLPVKFTTHLGAPDYRLVSAGSPARSAGYLAWVQGTALPLGGRAARALS